MVAVRPARMAVAVFMLIKIGCCSGYCVSLIALKSFGKD
jgi:hypothetical protein